MKNRTHTCACGPSCTCKNCTCSPQARTFDALGNETRLQLVLELRTKPLTVSQLVQATGTEQSAVSHGLRTLEGCGLVIASAEGKNRRYALAKTVEPLLVLLDKHLTIHPVVSAKPCCCHGGKP